MKAKVVDGAVLALFGVAYRFIWGILKQPAIVTLTAFRRRSIALGVCLLVGNVPSSFAGYSIQSNVETVPGTNTYTWTVYNQDQTWGLDLFGIEVPVATHVLSFTVPPPYANPDGTAYWIMQETTTATVDPHDNSVIVPAAQPGRKWLLWQGEQSPSVYPPGTTATFSLKTDSSVKPGFVRESAVTYTPQNNPHYYFPWPASATGPAAVVTTNPGSPVRVSTGYYDLPPGSVQGGSPLPLPNPWYGSSNTTYYGNISQATNSDPDINALLLENLGTSVATLSAASMGGRSDLFVLNSITNPIQLLPNQLYILAGVDGSDGPDPGFPNVVYLTINGTNYSYNDAVNLTYYPGGVLNGFPVSTNETVPWTTIYTPDGVTPPAFLGITKTDSTISLKWSSEFGQVYQLQYRADLASTNWYDLGEPITATSATLTFNDSMTSLQRFYRVVLLGQ